MDNRMADIEPGTEKPELDVKANSITEDTAPRISKPLMALFYAGAVACIFVASLEAMIPASFFVQAVEPWGVETSSLWMLAAYLIGYVAMILPTRRLADIFGQVAMFWTGLVLFVVFTGVSGNASVASTFAVLRAFQGAGAGMMTSVCMYVVGEQASDRSRALLVSGLALAQLGGIGAAHALGGKLAVDGKFRWAIYLAAPLAAAPALLCTPALIRSRKRSQESLGSRLLKFDIHKWDSATVLCLIIFGAVSAVLFLVWDMLGAKSQPIFNTRWLRERNLQISMLAVLLISMVFFSAAIYVPIMYITVRHEATDVAGRMTAPFWALSMGAALLGGLLIRLKPRLARPVAWAGLVIGAVFSGLYYTIDMEPTSLSKERAFYAIAGLGVGLAYPAVLYMAQISVPSDERGCAATVAHFLSVACLKSRLIINLDSIFSQSPFLASFDIRAMDIAGLEVSGGTITSYEPKLAPKIGAGMIDALHTTFVLSVPFLGAALIATLLYKHSH
ncbi:major facilitator superfamily domain-containing protein [Coemansia mojavensis]|nr:major facilitator superfamily domain-containing protein [Coemansia mojavensis]